MNEWNISDIGKIIVYKNESVLKEELKNEEVAIYGVDPRVANIVKTIDYPIGFSSKITSVVGLVKSQEKSSERELAHSGDWYCRGYVSKDQMGELERIANASKIPLNEDVSSPDTFH